MNLRHVLILSLFLGFLLRIALITEFPTGFNADEAGQGYSAYSILKTGRDEWGELLPLFPRGFGDYKAPLYTFLTIPSVALFGLSEFSTRLPAVLFGTLSILLVYLLTRELFDSHTGMWAAVLLAISPWHIQVSRSAFEGGLGIFFVSLGLLLAIKGIHNRRYLYSGFLFLAINTYTYHSWRLATLLLTIILIPFLRSRGVKRIYLLTSLGIFFVIFLPTLLNFKLVLKRASDVSIFSSQNVAGYFTNRPQIPIHPAIVKIFDNKYIFVGGQFITNYLSYFSPTFFFTGARPDNSHLNFPGTPLHYRIEIIFIAYAIYFLLREKHIHKKLIFGWFLLAPIAPALAGDLNANRGITILPLSVILSAFGLTRFLQSNPKVKPKLIFTILLISVVYFLFKYFFLLPQKPIYSQRASFREAFQTAISLENNYDSIHFSKRYTEPQSFLAFYKPWDPPDFQKNSKDWLRYESAGKKYVDQLESYNLGKYEIRDLNWSLDRNRGNVLLIGSNEDFPEDIKSLKDILDPSGKVLFRFVSVKDNQKP